MAVVHEIPDEFCMCGHPPRVHAPLDLGAAGRYYGKCILCDGCTVFIEYKDSVLKQEIERGAKKVQMGSKTESKQSLRSRILHRMSNKER